MAEDHDPTAVDAPAVSDPQQQHAAYRDPAQPARPEQSGVATEQHTAYDPPPTPRVSSVPPRRSDEPSTNLIVHDEDAAPSSTERAAESLRERRRERDAAAEKFATRLLLLIFLGIGGTALFLVNSDILFGGDETPSPKTATQVAAATPRSTPTAPELSARPVEAPDIPALGSLQREGLTVVAEGLPEILAVDPAVAPELLAGIESCRFAYGIWEFSPNKRFRFFTTCAGLEGEVLVGAYDLQGAVIKMSPLQSGLSSIRTEMDVEKPSTITSLVTIGRRGQPSVKLRVRQRATGIRPGMDGEGYRATYAGRNTIKVRALEAPAPRAPPAPSAPPRPTPPPKKPAPRDPILDLLGD